MVGLMAALRVFGALFSQVFLAIALLAALGPIELVRGVPPIRLSAAAAASAPAAIPSLSADIIVHAPKVVGAAVLTRAAQARLDGSARFANADFARLRGGFDVAGDASVWAQSPDLVALRSIYPDRGAVLLVAGASGARAAVVADVLNQREILVDYADWRGDGAVARGALMRDVSERGDWSLVQAWDVEAGAMGRTADAAYGFLHPHRAPR